MEKICTVLWLIFTGLLMLFCASLLASKPLIANDSAAGESASLEMQDWKTLEFHGKYFSICIVAGLQQARPLGITFLRTL